MIQAVNVELHCHTCYSKDSLMTPAKLLAVARRRRIHRLAVTDHNTIEGALEAQALDPSRFIVGLEVMTTEGELLAYFVKENVPSGSARKKPSIGCGLRERSSAFLTPMIRSATAPGRRMHCCASCPRLTPWKCSTPAR
jgi:hypothetical protein